MHHDGTLRLRLRHELDCDEPLPGAGLEFLKELLAGVVGDDELEAGRRLDQLAGLVYRQHPAIVGQWVDDHDGIGPCLDQLVEVADSPCRAAIVSGPSRQTVSPFTTR